MQFRLQPLTRGLLGVRGHRVTARCIAPKQAPVPPFICIPSPPEYLDYLKPAIMGGPVPDGSDELPYPAHEEDWDAIYARSDAIHEAVNSFTAKCMELDPRYRKAVMDVCEAVARTMK